MNIKSATFVKGIIGSNEILYDGRFQVAVMGRSNVGKSTLINSLTERKNLARSSSNPGRTIRMDIFLINNYFYLIDFPGYGYAKKSNKEREKLAKMMLWYIMYSDVKNRFIILVVDAKVGITPFDKDMIKTFQEHRVNHIIVANKTDNLPMSRLEKQLSNMRLEIPNSEIIPYTSKQKQKGHELMERISSFID